MGRPTGEVSAGEEEEVSVMEWEPRELDGELRGQAVVELPRESVQDQAMSLLAEKRLEEVPYPLSHLTYRLRAVRPTMAGSSLPMESFSCKAVVAPLTIAIPPPTTSDSTKKTKRTIGNLLRLPWTPSRRPIGAMSEGV